MINRAGSSFLIGTSQVVQVAYNPHISVLSQFAIQFRAVYTRIPSDC
jgi:hypothetical protein